MHTPPYIRARLMKYGKDRLVRRAAALFKHMLLRDMSLNPRYRKTTAGWVSEVVKQLSSQGHCQTNGNSIRIAGEDSAARL